MRDFHPFADDEACAVLGGLAIENGRAALVVSGSCEITRDVAGLDRARALASILADTIRAIEETPDAEPMRADRPKVVTVPNPFG